ncbi:hypothetical protein H6F86_21045 [Phormidium sp. FACHB-592]|uniref:Uncharacterized protein n=1 Tax=Stenomitos frigidus AS-A4 TaxID=2933935 RepID=A0ABV0KEQ9_9CYAN|nr:hypothetical protein [Phormidium sp. FACHB-592]MBD2076322.1 hypothetical protein [Phormidium sp. FACHB-592]
MTNHSLLPANSLSDRTFPVDGLHQVNITHWRSMQFIRVGNRVINLNDISLVEIKEESDSPYSEASYSVVMTTIRGETILFDDPTEVKALRLYLYQVEDIVQP